MHSLYVVTILVFLCITCSAVKTFFKVRDNDLGIEEVLITTVIFNSLLNIGIDVLCFINISGLHYATLSDKLTVGSRIFEALTSILLIQYIRLASKMRSASKEK